MFIKAKCPFIFHFQLVIRTLLDFVLLLNRLIDFTPIDIVDYDKLEKKQDDWQENESRKIIMV